MACKDKVTALVDEYGLPYVVHQLVTNLAQEIADMALDGRTHGPKYATRVKQYEALNKAWKKL